MKNLTTKSRPTQKAMSTTPAIPIGSKTPGTKTIALFSCLIYGLFLSACSTHPQSLQPAANNDAQNPGSETTRTGRCVSGDCKNGYGIVEYTDAKGGKYVGQWANGCWDGQGTYTEPSSDGFKYVGTFKDCGYHGYGTQTWASGDQYIGEFEHGERHGKGAYTWADGDEYQGDFLHGQRTGYALLTFNNDDSFVEYEGQFKNGMKHGQGIYIMKNGTRAEVVHVDDELHGETRLFRANGSQAVLTWDMGKLISQQEIETQTTAPAVTAEPAVINTPSGHRWSKPGG